MQRHHASRPLLPGMRATRGRSLTVAAVAAVVTTVAALAGCAGAPAVEPIRIGWSPEIATLDPVENDSPGAFTLLDQVHASLLTIEEGQPVLDLAASAEFTAPGEYTVRLKPNLEFANGDDLTSSDVVFSFERQQMLRTDGGPWPQLDNIDAIEAPDDLTIVFRLRTDDDAGFPYVLAGQAALVLDEEVFFADAVTPDDVVLEARAFGGQYVMTRKQDVTTLTPNSRYGGPRAALSTLELHPGDPDDLAAQLRAGTIDVLLGRLPASAIDTLTADSELAVARAASGRVRLLAFDLARMPYGTQRADADAAKALAVRIAIADVIDRDALVQTVGPNQIAPLTDYLPKGVEGAGDALADVAGDGLGGPDVEKAAAALAAVGITTPVDLTIHVAPDLAGGPASEELAALADQLEASDLFRVEVVELDAAGLADARNAGEVSILFTTLAASTLDPYQYLAPYGTEGGIAPGYSDEAVDDLLAAERTESDPEKRLAALDELQAAIAVQLPVIPISQGVRVVYSNPSILGVTLHDALPLDLSALSR